VRLLIRDTGKKGVIRVIHISKHRSKLAPFPDSEPKTSAATINSSVIAHRRL
jgi:hypothetical protein